MVFEARNNFQGETWIKYKYIGKNFTFMNRGILSEGQRQKERKKEKEKKEREKERKKEKE